MPNIIGTAPNQVPTNGDLGTMAFEDAINYNEKTIPNVIEVNSSNTALRVTQTGSGNALLVEDSTNPDSTPFVIDANGKQIIGYTNTILALGITPASQITGSTLATSTALGTCFANDATSAGSYYLAKSRGSIGTIGTIVQSGDTVGNIQFLGDDGAALIRAATISAAVDGTPGANDMPGRLVFSTTADGASSPTERMRIDSAGRVGIGSASFNGIGSLYAARNITGSTFSYGILSAGTVQSDVTNTAYYYRTTVSTQATAFTLSNLVHYACEQGTFGAGSTVTNQYGFSSGSSLTSATNNYGFHSNIASGTGRWNFYAAGSADNYFAGNLGVGTTPAVNLDVYNATNAQIRASGSTVDLRVRADSSGSVGIVGTYSNVPLLFNTNSTERMRIDPIGNLIQSAPTTAPTLSTNGTMVFNLTSNTNLRVSVRGSDGVTRTANITLA